MKNFISHLLFVFVANTALSQISFNVIKEDVKCNYQGYGGIEINVTSTNFPYTYLWSNGDTTNIIVNLNEGNYSVIVTDGLGNDTTIYVQINLLICEMAPELVFTPNDDGVNDTWSIQNYEFFPQSKVMVFNRLGQIVYQKNGIYEDWDGKDLFGVPVPDASYYYVVYHDKKDDSTIIKGSVTILK